MMKFQGRQAIQKPTKRGIEVWILVPMATSANLMCTQARERSEEKDLGHTFDERSEEQDSHRFMARCKFLYILQKCQQNFDFIH